MSQPCKTIATLRGKCLTERLNVVLIPAALDILDHQARLPDLRIPDHAHFDYHTRILLLPLAVPTCTAIVLPLALRARRSAQAVAVLRVLRRAALRLRVGGPREARVGVGRLRAGLVLWLLGLHGGGGDGVHAGIVDVGAAGS